ncbi:MAG: hypothetical protein M3O02_01305 [Acidobacteriota bacterium]|nr:hypothetical protein [Acidobacteriota bacterium]
MTLLNAPEFDQRKETRRRNALVGSGAFIALVVILALAGFMLGHGWMFMNLPVEHRVKVFFSALQSGDYPTAYGIWYNDPQWQQHPDKYKDYPIQRFTEDFTTESNWKGPITSYHVDFSKRDATGTVVASTVNGRNLTLKVQRADNTITYFPFELTRGVF